MSHELPIQRFRTTDRGYAVKCALDENAFSLNVSREGNSVALIFSREFARELRTFLDGALVDDSVPTV
jgi:hypothetical protein